MTKLTDIHYEERCRAARMISTSVEAAAVHEAGHAVVGIALGGIVERVTLPGDGSGRVEWFIYPWRVPPRTRWGTQNFLPANLTMTVAGPLAEVHYGPPLFPGIKVPDPRVISRRLASGENPSDRRDDEEGQQSPGDLYVAYVKACGLVHYPERGMKKVHAIIRHAERVARRMLAENEEILRKVTRAFLGGSHRCLVAATKP